MLLQLGGSQLLQIGTATPSDNGVTPGGALTVLNLAHCVAGNGNGSCINDADCGKDASGSTGVCTGNPTALGEVTFTGAPAYPTGLGPVLNVQATCSNSIPTCLVTHTTDSGNGTTADGSINLTTGHYTSKAPIITDVFVYGATDCATARPCPVCDAATKACISPDGHPFNIGACDAADQSVTIECLPAGTTGIHVPNPFELTTDPKFMAPVVGNKFCGFCDSSAAGGCQGGADMCANGCQTPTDCAGVAGATVCDFGNSADGFLGNTGTSIITAPGTTNQYEPVVSGIFCTGITSNGTVNGAAGLPGPVRVVLPYTLGYVVGNN
jgi:hypothetical protein